MLIGCESISKIMEEDHAPINLLVSDKTICKTAPATPGLLNVENYSNLRKPLDLGLGLSRPANLNKFIQHVWKCVRMGSVIAVAVISI